MQHTEMSAQLAKVRAVLDSKPLNHFTMHSDDPLASALDSLFLELHSALNVRDTTTTDLREALAQQLEHGVKLNIALDDAVTTINSLFDIVGSLVEHVNIFHAQHGIEPMEHPFENLEYQAFPQETK